MEQSSNHPSFSAHPFNILINRRLLRSLRLGDLRTYKGATQPHPAFIFISAKLHLLHIYGALLFAVSLEPMVIASLMTDP